MSEPIVRAANVSKRFHRFRQQPFLVRNALLRLIGHSTEREEFWPLVDVSFEIHAGEAVGILGANGAGKSTLLRMIAGTCFPTRGTVATRGRVAPLLSLGVGFHPDMTGRECVLLNAVVLGLTKREIEACLPSIVKFAELEAFIDTPVRCFSSGMQARLGVSVAVHTAADVMLLDEVLAVGDHAFQQKCVARLEALKAEGTTLIVVSHSADAIRRLCGRAIWLKDGAIARDGLASEVVEAYLAGSADAR